MEGEMPHRGDTPMADVRDCALAHIEAAERPAAAGLRFILSTPTAVPRASTVVRRKPLCSSQARHRERPSMD